MNDLLLKSVLHGRSICNSTINHFNRKLPSVNSTEDLIILSVLDKRSDSNASINLINSDNFSIHKIFVTKYIKWISKIESLHDYIKLNYNSLPKYLMYLDAADTLIINNILDVENLLKFYKCRVLFNSEYGYWHTGFPSPPGTKKYYDTLYTKVKSEYFKLTKQKYGFTDLVQASLNAGAFIGETEYILNMLSQVMLLMKGDPEKGFPYGCQDDQCALKFFHSENFEDTSIDIFHKFFFWGTPDSLLSKKNQASPNYFANLKHNYK